MWKVNVIDIQMTEGDYGIALPVTIEGIDHEVNDSVAFTVKDKVDGDPLILNVYVLETAPTFDIIMDRNDELPVGEYVYTMDWLRGTQFRCNIISCGVFRVVNKA